jgi:hypothetical protein
MAIARITVWIANDILTAAALNGEFNAIFGAAGQAVSFPRTAAADFDGQTLILDADADTTLRSNVDDEIDIAIGGVDTYLLTATEMTILGKRVLTIDDLRKSGLASIMPIVYENRNRITANENSNDAVLAAQSFGF